MLNHFLLSCVKQRGKLAVLTLWAMPSPVTDAVESLMQCMVDVSRAARRRRCVRFAAATRGIGGGAILAPCYDGHPEEERENEG